MVTPNPVAPKPKKPKSNKQKGFTTEELTRYLATGGSLTDIAGSKITQGQVLQALSNPQLLGPIINSLAANFGQTGSFDPNAQYGSTIPTFEASFNPIKNKYTNLEGVQAQIANDLFASIDSGVDPVIAASKLLDSNFLKSNYGVDSSQIGNLGANLVADAEEYKKAEEKRKSAVVEQNYDAWRKGVTETGSTPSEYIANALGIPALRNLPDPTKGYTASKDELMADPRVLQALGRFNPRLAETSPYKPSAALQEAARRYSSGVKLPDRTGETVEKIFGSGKYSGTRDYIPESYLGQRVMGLDKVNDFIGNVLGSGLGFIARAKSSASESTANTPRSKAQLAEAQKKAYDEFIGKSSESRMADAAAKRREEILNIASRLIAERGQEMAGRGITPFTAGLSQINKVLGGTNIPIVKK